MRNADRKEFGLLLAAAAEYYGRELSVSTIGMYWAGLEDMDLDSVRSAMNAHIRDPKRGQFMPKIADIRGAVMARLEHDGRPGAEEAWAMLPRDETGSVVWTAEMAAAFGVALPLIEEGDRIAARMAFREAYTHAVDVARARGIPPTWTPSLGRDPQQREVALRDAVERGRISLEYAHKLAPALPITKAGAELIDQARATLRIKR